MKWSVLALLLIGCAHSQGPRPTQNGDTIGGVTMLADGTIRQSLLSYECNGMAAHGSFDIAPGTVGHKAILERYGALRPGESKPIIASNVKPCPKR